MGISTVIIGTMFSILIGHQIFLYQKINRLDKIIGFKNDIAAFEFVIPKIQELNDSRLKQDTSINHISSCLATHIHMYYSDEKRLLDHLKLEKHTIPSEPEKIVFKPAKK